MIDWSQCPEVEMDSRKLSGAPVFRGTRVPLRALFENFESGANLTEFVEWFPGVTQEQVHAVLELLTKNSEIHLTNKNAAAA